MTMGNYRIFLAVFAVIQVHILTVAAFFPDVYPTIEAPALRSNIAGDPLIITPYLKNGSATMARTLSKVTLTEHLGIESHAGFFKVDPRHDSNLFFWYFPAFSKQPDAPVLLWLQGGPGSSSLLGLFSEIGPVIVTHKGIMKRKVHWALEYNLIFIDNPVGTGFSFTGDKSGYCTDQDCVAVGLYNAMNQFYKLFPNLRKNEFYISGESYAGKYIPPLGMKIYRMNLKVSDQINLKGLLMGNALCDPINQIDYGQYLYHHGLIDNNQLAIFEQKQNAVKDAITKNKWALAHFLMDEIMGGSESNFSYYSNFTGFKHYYNILTNEPGLDKSVLYRFLTNEEARKSMHVGGLPFQNNKEVRLHLLNDFGQSVAPYIEELLSHYRVLFYTGQLDIIVAYPLTENFLRHLQFDSSEEYKTAKRNLWYVQQELAGYYKTAGNLTEIMVRNAGHMVPRDQPKLAYDMLTRFISKKYLPSY